MATTLMRLVPGATDNTLYMDNGIVSYLSNFFHLMCPYTDTQFLEMPPPGIKVSQDRIIYDYFISYRHKISAKYAHALRDELISMGYKVYFAGEVPELSSMDDEQLKYALQQELHKSSILIIMGSEEALGGDWVKWEMETFSTDHWGRKIPLITNDLPAFNVSLRNIHRKDPSALFLYEEDEGAWEKDKPSATTILCLILAREFFRVEFKFWYGCAKLPPEKREQAFFRAIYYDKLCSTVMGFCFAKDRDNLVDKLRSGYLKELRNYKRPWWKSTIDWIIAYILLLPAMTIYAFTHRLFAKLKMVFSKKEEKHEIDPGSIFVLNPVTGYSKDVAIKDFRQPHSADPQPGSGLSQEEKEQLQQSIEEYKKAVAIEEAKSATINPELPKLYRTLTGLYYELGDHRQAYEYCVKALVMNKDIAGYYTQNDDYSEAIIYYENALEIQEKIYLADDPSLGAAYSNIGDIYTIAGNPTQGLMYHFKGLAINEAVLAPTDPDLGSAYYNIAIAYSYLPDLTNCCEFMQKAVDIWEKALPATDERLMASRDYLVQLNAALKKTN